MKVSYKDVRREHFDKVADIAWEDKELRPVVTVCYTGNGLYGDMTIECASGNIKEANKILKIATDILVGE